MNLPKTNTLCCNARMISDDEFVLCLLISGAVCALHYPQHSRALHRMRIPTIHVIDAAAQLNHLLHSLHELLRPKLLQKEVRGNEKS